MNKNKDIRFRCKVILVSITCIGMLFVPSRAYAKEIQYNSSGVKQEEDCGILSMEKIKAFLQVSLEQVEEAVKATQAQVNTKIGATEKSDVTEATEATSGLILDTTVYPTGEYPILGKSSVTVEQMVQFFQNHKGVYPSKVLKKGGAPDIETFCQIFYEEATAEGVKPEVAYAQAMKETGWLAYGGDSTPQQYNFAGLGTTGGGVKGNAYQDVRTGIRAQIQHLKAYATDGVLNNSCVDDRYDYVKKGCAPYVEWLGQQENPSGTGWATAKNYGYDIVDMIGIMRAL